MMKNNIEYFKIDDTNVLAIEHLLKKVKGGKKQKLMYYEILNSNSIHYRKRLGNKKLPLSNYKYKLLKNSCNNNQLNNNQLKHNDYYIKDSTLSNLIKKYNLNLNIINRTLIKSEKLKNSTSSIVSRDKIRGGSQFKIEENIRDSLIRYYISFHSKISKFKETIHTFSKQIMNNLSNTETKNPIDELLFYIHCDIIIRLSKTSNKKTKYFDNFSKNENGTVTKNRQNNYKELARYLNEYSKYFVSLFRYSLLNYNFIHKYNKPTSTKLSDFNETFTLYKNCKSFTDISKNNDNKISGIIYYLIESNYYTFNEFKMDPYLFCFFLHMYCFKYLDIIDFSDTDLLNKYTKLFIDTKIKKTELDKLKTHCKDYSLLNNDDFIKRIKYLLDIQNNNSRNIFAFTSKDKITNEHKKSLMKNYNKFNLNCLFSSFEIINKNNLKSYVNFVRVV